MAIDVVVEEVADNLTEMAEATRRINTNAVGFFLGGAAVGLAVGFYFGYKRNKEAIKAEAFRQSEEEIAKIREHYHQKGIAAEPKPSVEEIVEERGYDRPLPAPVPVREAPVPVVQEKDRNDGWDFPTELKGRLHREHYVIHQDEFMDKETGYNQVTYTYYAGDDVLVDDENNQPLPHADQVVGVDNLKFGHGTDDEDVVFVRNDRLELEMEICRTQDSYEEEVLGIIRDDPDTD